MKKQLKKIPHFRSEDQERTFWSTHDSEEYIDWSSAKKVRFSRLKPSTTTISIRLPQSMLEDIKILAQKRDVPYQSMMKIMLDSKLREEKAISR